MSLTAKQQRFVEEYCGDGKFNGTDAAIRAGYSERSAGSIAHEMLGFEHIQEGIAIRMAKMAERCAVSVESVTAQLMEDRNLAHQVGQASAAVSASMGLAKLHGLITDKQEMTGKNGTPLIPTAIQIIGVKPRTNHQGGTSPEDS